MGKIKDLDQIFSKVFILILPLDTFASLMEPQIFEFLLWMLFSHAAF